MANTDAPRGLWPIRHLTGGEVRLQTYDIDVSDTTLITAGDLVKRETDGNITRAANNETYLGVADGFSWIDADGNQQHSRQIPATKTNFTSLKALIYDDPFIVFGIQADGNTVEADIFATFPAVVGAGNTTTKLSIFELDTTGGTGDDVKIIGKIDTPNNAWGTNVNVEVVIVDHAYLTSPAGV